MFSIGSGCVTQTMKRRIIAVVLDSVLNPLARPFVRRKGLPVDALIVFRRSWRRRFPTKFRRRPLLSGPSRSAYPGVLPHSGALSHSGSLSHHARGVTVRLCLPAANKFCTLYWLTRHRGKSNVGKSTSRFFCVRLSHQQAKFLTSW